MKTHRLLRTVLYLPASNQKMVEKAVSLTYCDGFIFDCEDAVAKDAKDKTREGVLKALSLMKNSERTVAVRVNGVNTPWFKDDCLVARGADAVVLPKAEKAYEIHLLRALIGEKPDIWCMIETPLGVLNSLELAQLSNVLVMGTVDLANELRCSTDPKLERFPLMSSIQHTLLAAKASGIQALDGVYIHLQDDVGFEKECEQGFQLGFDGKTLIHPKTIDTANRYFSPSEHTIAEAQKIVKAYENSPKGATTLDGRLVEELHVRRAQNTLRYADLIKNRKM